VLFRSSLARVARRPLIAHKIGIELLVVLAVKRSRVRLVWPALGCVPPWASCPHRFAPVTKQCSLISVKKGEGSAHSITERRVPELISVLGSQPAGDVSHNPGGRLPLLSARPAVTPATLKRSAANFAAW